MNGGALDVGLNRVDHLALRVDQHCQILEDLIHVGDVGLELAANSQLVSAGNPYFIYWLTKRAIFIPNHFFHESSNNFVSNLLF